MVHVRGRRRGRVHRQRGHVALGGGRGHGRERWRLQTGGEVYSTPVVADGTVYVGSLDNFPYAMHT
ncbi:PQQ-binding-like beta-propeller repeat protein [Streptomyces sp. NPDC048504]|uniref:PQQ-binding-like beta-propeller repeat protein n=1 Tax=Streptomyces sp. NPDC048504 TaxID=3365559 RepID=UPI003710F263